MWTLVWVSCAVAGTALVGLIVVRGILWPVGCWLLRSPARVSFLGLALLMTWLLAGCMPASSPADQAAQFGYCTANGLTLANELRCGVWLGTEGWDGEVWR